MNQEAGSDQIPICQHLELGYIRTEIYNDQIKISVSVWVQQQNKGNRKGMGELEDRIIEIIQSEQWRENRRKIK